MAVPSILPVAVPMAVASIFIGAAAMLAFVLYAFALASSAARALTEGDWNDCNDEAWWGIVEGRSRTLIQSMCKRFFVGELIVFYACASEL